MKKHLVILYVMLLALHVNAQVSLNPTIDRISNLIRNYQTDSAFILLNEIEPLVRKDSNPFQRIAYWELMLNYNNNIGNLQQTKLYFDSLNQSIEHVKPAVWIDSFYVAKAYNNMASFYMQKFQFSKSADFFRKALAFTNSRPHEQMRSYFFQNLGASLLRTGAVEEGILNINRAFELYEHHRDYMGKIECADQIATTMVDYRNFQLSRKFFAIAQSLTDSVDQPYTEISLDNNIGRMYNYMAEYDSALLFFEKALQEANVQKIWILQAIGHSNIGEVLLKKGNYELADSHLKPALELFANYGVDMGVFQVNSLLAYRAFRMGDLNAASNYQNRAEALLKQAGEYPSLMLDFYKRSYEIKRGLRDFDDALRYLEFHQELQDSVTNVLTIWNVNEIESRLMTSIKEKQLIQKEDELLRAERSKLRILLVAIVGLFIFGLLYWFLFYRSQKEKQLFQVREQLLEEEHQRGVLQMQLMLVRNRLSPHFISNLFLDLKQLVNNSERERALEQLNKLSKLVLYTYTHTDSIAVRLGDELEFVQNFLEVKAYHLGPDFTFAIQSEPSLASVQIPALSVQLFVENAIKHGLMYKGGAKTIVLRVADRVQFIQIEIEDNGIGREAATRFKTGGTGMGFFILKKVTEHLNAQNKQHIEWNITDLLNPDGTAAGTKIEVTVPKNFNFQA
jgi:tetratricopeptide (TPR) repeat protein